MPLPAFLSAPLKLPAAALLSALLLSGCVDPLASMSPAQPEAPAVPVATDPTIYAAR